MRERKKGRKENGDNEKKDKINNIFKGKNKGRERSKEKEEKEREERERGGGKEKKRIKEKCPQDATG